MKRKSLFANVAGGLLALALVFGASVLFTSCGDDDDSGKLDNAANVNGKKVKVEKATISIYGNGANLELACDDDTDFHITVGDGLNGKTIDMTKELLAKGTSFDFAAVSPDEEASYWDFWLEQNDKAIFFVDSWGQSGQARDVVKKGKLYVKYSANGNLNIQVKDLQVDIYEKSATGSPSGTCSVELSYNGEAKVENPY